MGGRFASLTAMPLLWGAGLLGSCVDSSAPPSRVSHDASTPDAASPDAAFYAVAAEPCIDPVAPSDGAASAGPGPYAWRNVTILGGGFVTGIEFSPVRSDVLFARTDVGGAYRWDPAAQNWLPITDWVGRDDSNLMGIESLAPDPADANVVYVAAGEYLTSGNGMILRSTDMGATWTQNAIAVPMGGNVDGRNMGERLAVDPNLTSTLYFGSRNTGLWTSTDAASTWSSVNGFPVRGTAKYGLTFVLFDKRAGSLGTATSTMYVGVTTSSTTSAGRLVTSIAPSLYRTIDGGSTWQPVPGQPTNMFPHHAAMDYATGILYLTFNNAWGPNNVTAGAVWKLDTASDTWTNISPPAGKGGVGGISVDALHPDTLVVSTLDRWPDEIYRTTNGGTSWTAIGSPASHDVAGARWLFWGGSALSPTAWNGWMGDIEIDPHNPGRVLYNTGQGVWWSEDATDSSAHWKFQNQGIEETVALGLISPSGGAHLLSAVGDIGGFLHDDLTTSSPAGMFSNPVFGNTSSIDFSEQHPAIIARVGTSSSSANTSRHGGYSIDGGATWTPFGVEPNTSANSGSIAVSADGVTFVWAPQGAGAAYSRDRGTTWAACSALPSGARVAADRVNPNRFYAASADCTAPSGCNGGTLYASHDGGATFVAVATLPSGGATVRPISGIEGDLWIATGGNGLYHWTDPSPTLARISGVQNASAVGFGRGVTCRAPYPVLYLAGMANGVSGIYRSDDGGATWQRIDDQQHQFGYVSYITGDPRLYGRVYLGTGGRGILYGDRLLGSP